MTLHRIAQELAERGPVVVVADRRQISRGVPGRVATPQYLIQAVRSGAV
jgi:hypothetical protein